MHHFCFIHFVTNIFSHLEVWTWDTTINDSLWHFGIKSTIDGFILFWGEDLVLILHYSVSGTFNKWVFCMMNWQNFDVSHNYVKIRALMFYWMQIFVFFQPENLVLSYTQDFFWK
jgi:hypothetical protein